ncbi:NEQ288 [Nanoarchaeum equitans Kin4-M]|uniref:NEQ288 n=1 Tax=Nanoarchaeum equitans (strain Kin4-M) TaxID=228908 RepID=Q74MT3_NANEQ|nr:NEQ288 [Nanoarchaeum equitans Kin4-M]
MPAKRDRGIPLAAVERILKEEAKKVGVTRVSDKAVRLLKEKLEQIYAEIAKEALKLATHAKRKTIKKEDVLNAAKVVVKNLV